MLPLAGITPLTYRVHLLYMIHKISLPQVDGQLETAHSGRKGGEVGLVFAIELTNIFQPWVASEDLQTLL